MKKVSLIPLLIFATIVSAIAQNKEDASFSVVFYNVENLFDTEDDPMKADEEFTPGGEKKWDEIKYRKKLDDIAKVLCSVWKDELPEVIGLAEVENRKVLEDLINTGGLGKGKYRVIHSEGPDERGIDVALLYREDGMTDVSFETLPVHFPFDTADVTRDILYVKGKAKDGRYFHFFVNHWSSRSEGTAKSEPKRLQCAATLRRKADFLLGSEPDARIVIMGDFNDEPTNRSIMNVLLATNKRKNTGPGDLFNLFYDLHNTGNNGSYNYRGTWNMMDQIIVSYNLIGSKGYYSCDYDDGLIFSEDWMMYKTPDGTEVPGRTYGGPNYYGGISDHLPVTLRLKIK